MTPEEKYLLLLPIHSQVQQKEMRNLKWLIVGALLLGGGALLFL
jgi:hypothetical protein